MPVDVLEDILINEIVSLASLWKFSKSQDNTTDIG